MSSIKKILALALATGLSGCAMPERAAHPTRYDFGPGATAPPAAADASRPALALRV